MVWQTRVPTIGHPRLSFTGRTRGLYQEIVWLDGFSFTALRHRAETGGELINSEDGSAYLWAAGKQRVWGLPAHGQR